MRSELHDKLDIPAGMKARLEAYKRSVRRVKLAEGLLAAAFGLLVSYICVFGLDRVMNTPAWLRGGILVSGALGLGLFFPLKCHRWIWGTRRMEQVARLLKHKFPRTSDQLLGIVELARSESEQQRSQTLVRAAMQQVDASIRDRDFTDAVPRPRHRQWAWATVVPAILVIVAVVAVPSAGANTFLRWIMPWKNTERYTFARLEPLPEKVVVPYAESFDIDAVLQENTEWSPASGQVRYGKQPPVRATLSGRRYHFELPPQKEAARLALSIGDVRESIVVEPMARPELKQLRAHIRLPDYLQYSTELVADVRGGVVSLVRGSQARFEAAASRPLTEAQVDGELVPVGGTAFSVSTPVITDSVARSLTWKDEYGLTPRDPFLLKINALDDSPPVIGCERLDLQQVVLESDVVRFDVDISDDFGVKRVGVEWEGVEDPLRNPEPAKGERIIAAGAPEQREIDMIAAFSAKTEGLSPQTLRLRVFAEDYKADHERAYSAVYTLHVLSPDEHFAWMTEQMGRWLRQAEGVYEHELQLHDINRQLRQLSPEEIDDPKNRRRIAQQAAAERANGARLAALTGNGRRMIEEAARNEQFQVGHLETWAEMLQRLDDIAANRMPSVADMIDNAAKAQGKPASGDPKAGKTPPSAGQNRGDQSGDGKSDESGKPPETAVPTVSDVESGMNKKKESGDAPPKPSGPSRLSLPNTILQGGPPQEPQACPAQQELDEAVEKQADLLADFEEIRDELNKVMGELENSTFVKRLKAASRRQLDVAADLNRTLTAAFGVEPKELEDRQRERAEKIAKREVAQSENVYLIQEDLEAYFNRKQDVKFREILDDMDDTRVVTKLRGLADRVRDNLKGESIARSEYWADTLDRWAEELVQPAPGGA